MGRGQEKLPDSKLHTWPMLTTLSKATAALPLDFPHPHLLTYSVRFALSDVIISLPLGCEPLEGRGLFLLPSVSPAPRTMPGRH